MDSVSVSLAFIDGLGGMEMLLVFVIALLLFGGDKLPGFARSIGKTMREFKKAASGVEEEFKRALEEDERKENAKRLAAPSPASADPAAPHAEDHGYGHDSASTPAAAAPADPTAAASATATPADPASNAAASTAPVDATLAPPPAAALASDEPLAPAAPAPKPVAPPAPVAAPKPPPAHVDFL